MGRLPNSNDITVSWFYSDVEYVVEIGDVADGEL
jgi:hypothetical protein